MLAYVCVANVYDVHANLCVAISTYEHLHTYKRTIHQLLRRAKGIEDVTLIVSYDGVYKEVAEAIASIDFCRVSGKYEC